MVHVHTGILFSHKKEGSLAICNNMNGPWRYYAKWNKSERKRQIPYDPFYMCNLKQKTKSQAHIYREEIGSCQRQGSGKWVEKILVDFPRLLCLYTSNF